MIRSSFVVTFFSIKLLFLYSSSKTWKILGSLLLFLHFQLYLYLSVLLNNKQELFKFFFCYVEVNRMYSPLHKLLELAITASGKKKIQQPLVVSHDAFIAFTYYTLSTMNVYDEVNKILKREISPKWRSKSQLRLRTFTAHISLVVKNHLKPINV